MLNSINPSSQIDMRGLCTLRILSALLLLLIAVSCGCNGCRSGVEGGDVLLDRRVLSDLSFTDDPSAIALDLLHDIELEEYVIALPESERKCTIATKGRTVKNILSDMSRMTSMEWTIQDGVFYAGPRWVLDRVVELKGALPPENTLPGLSENIPFCGADLTLADLKKYFEQSSAGILIEFRKGSHHVGGGVKVRRAAG